MSGSVKGNTITARVVDTEGGWALACKKMQAHLLVMRTSAESSLLIPGKLVYLVTSEQNAV